MFIGTKRFFLSLLQGDFHHWLSLFNRFDEILEATLKDRKDVSLDGMPEPHEAPFPWRSVLSILRVSTTILENCSNKHLYQSHEVVPYACILQLPVCLHFPPEEKRGFIG